MLQNKKPYLLILPALLTISILFIGGISEGFLKSIGIKTIIGESNFTIKYYSGLLLSNEFWDSFFITLRISLISTVTSGILGMIITYCLFIIKSNKSFKKMTFSLRFIQIPLLFPYLISAYLIFLLFTQSGLISRIVYNLGIIDSMGEFPILVNDKFGIGIIITYVWKTCPFVVLMLYPIILKMKKSWVEVGRVLGANKLLIFKEVLFPLLVRPFIMACFIVFSYTFLAFEVPYLLGVTYPKTLSVYAYQLYTSGKLIERPTVMAINMISIFFIGISGIVTYKVYKKRIKWKKDENE